MVAALRLFIYADRGCGRLARPRTRRKLPVQNPAVPGKCSRRENGVREARAGRLPVNRTAAAVAEPVGCPQHRRGGNPSRFGPNHPRFGRASCDRAGPIRVIRGLVAEFGSTRYRAASGAVCSWWLQRGAGTRTTSYKKDEPRCFRAVMPANPLQRFSPHACPGWHAPLPVVLRPVKNHAPLCGPSSRVALH